MGAIASQITRVTSVYSTVYSDADQRKHQISVSLIFVRGIHRWPVNSPHKWPVSRKMLPFDHVIMVQPNVSNEITWISMPEHRTPQIQSYWLWWSTDSPMPNIIWYISLYHEEARTVQFTPLQWCHNGRDSVSNHQPHHFLLNRLFGCRSKKTSKLRVTGLCVGTSPGTGELPAQVASNAENVSIWWRHHAIREMITIS